MRVGPSGGGGWSWPQPLRAARSMHCGLPKQGARPRPGLPGAKSLAGGFGGPRRNFAPLPVPLQGRDSLARPPSRSPHRHKSGRAAEATARSILQVSKSLHFIRRCAGFLLFSRLILPSDSSLAEEDFAVRGRTSNMSGKINGPLLGGRLPSSRAAAAPAPGESVGSRRWGRDPPPDTSPAPRAKPPLPAAPSPRRGAGPHGRCRSVWWWGGEK